MWLNPYGREAVRRKLKNRQICIFCAFTELTKPPVNPFFPVCVCKYLVHIFLQYIVNDIFSKLNHKI